MIRHLALLLGLFLFLGALFIISNGNLHLTDHEQRLLFLREYYAWLFGFGSKVLDVQGNVVKTNWLPSVMNSSR